MKRPRNVKIGRSQNRRRSLRAERLLGFETRDGVMSTQQLSITGLRQANRLKISLEDILLALGYERELVQLLASHSRNR